MPTMFIDKDGKILTAAAWREDALPALLDDRAVDVDGLCQIALLAVEGGFADDAVAIADRLAAAAVDDERACLACVALWTAAQQHQPAHRGRAGDLLSAFEDKHGQRPSTMLARARLLAAIGKASDGLLLARAALRLDPDLHPGLSWAVALADHLAVVRGDVDNAAAPVPDARALLEELAGLERGWRARAVLALWHIQRGLDDGDDAGGTDHEGAARGLLARLVAEANPGVDVAALQEQAGPGLSALAERRAARARAQQPTEVVSAVPLSGPVWAAVLKDASSLAPSTSPLVPSSSSSSSSSHAGVVVFVLADEAAGDAAPRDGIVGAQTPTARLCRGIALALGEQIEARLGVRATVVSPVVSDHGFFVATRPWDLVALLGLVPLAPSLAGPRLVVSGSLKRGPGGAHRVVLDVHDLLQGGAPRHVDGGPVGIAGAVQPLLRAVGALLDVEKSATPAITAPRAHDVDDRYCGALADVHALLLVATGRLRPDQLWNEEAALTGLQALLSPSASSVGLSATLLLLSAVVCTTAVGRPVPAAILDVLEQQLARHASALQPLSSSAQRLIAAARA